MTQPDKTPNRVRMYTQTLLLAMILWFVVWSFFSISDLAARVDAICPIPQLNPPEPPPAPPKETP